MMRQSFIVVFIFCMFLFVIAYFPIDFSNKLQPELFIDSDALIVNRHYDFFDGVKEFQSTPLVSNVLGIDFTLISREFGVSQLDSERIREWLDTFNTTIEHPLIKELFGKEFTIVLPPEEEIGAYGDIDQVINRLLIIARPRHHARIIELFSDLIDLKRVVSEAKYGGYVIKRIPVEGERTVAVTRIKDLILLSFNERILRKSLDVYDDRRSIDYVNSDYKRIMREFDTYPSSGYVNLNLVFKTLTDSIPDLTPDAHQPYLTGNISKLSGYKNLIWGSGGDATFLHQKAIITFDPNNIQPEIRELITIKPSQSEAYKRISSDTIWYYWTNILRPKALLDLYHHNVLQSNDENGQNIINEVAEATGMNSEELLRLVENDLLIALKSSLDDQFIPLPRILVALKTNDSKKLFQVIESITEKYDIPLTRQSIDGINIYLWGGVVAAGQLQPAFTVTDEYLVMASNRQQIREFLKEGRGYKSLESSSQFRAVDIGLTGENNSVNYIDSRSMTLLAKEIISWIGTMIAIQDREVAQRSKILIDQVINPILDGLAMYASVGIRSYTENDTLVVESKILKKSGKR